MFSSMFGAFAMIVICVFVPVILFFWNYQRCSNKVLAYFLDATTGLKPELCKVVDTWALSKDGAYRLDEEMVRNVRYPTGWPRALQQVMPALLYLRGDVQPLDWRTASIDLATRISPREVGALLDSEWLRALVKGVREGTAGGLTKQERIFMFIGAGASALALIMIFVLMTRM